MDYGVEEQEHNFCSERLRRAIRQPLLIADNRLPAGFGVVIENVGHKTACYKSGQRAADRDNKRQRSVESLAGLELEVVEDIRLEHIRQQVRRAELKSRAEQADDEDYVEIKRLTVREIERADAERDDVDYDRINAGSYVEHP